ncbi:Zinc finger A20 and AN1 domain-containing stress-associated protein 8 [Capsicum chinense]|nr:Zinc finger A20 and AN1 domain-containing stress-associated protein 8 [Capsicum chinense]
MGRSQLICTGGSLMVTVQYSNDYKDDKNEEMQSSKETGCRAPEDHVLCINDCDFFGSAATMNMCSKFQKDMILLKQEHAKLAAASNKDVVRRSSSSDESELALAGAAIASADLASHISQVKSKEGFKKCTTCRHKPIMGRSQFICTGGSLMVTVQYNNDYKDDKNEEMQSSKETGCRAPEDPVLCINDCDFFGSAATMNMCSKFQKDMILLKQEHAKLAAASNKDVLRRSSSSDES